MDPEERRKDVLFILDTFDKKIHPAWKKLDYVKEHGHLPPEEIIQVKELDPLSLVTRRNSLRSYITKANKGKMDKAKIPLWQAEIEAIEKELEVIKNKS